MGEIRTPLPHDPSPKTKKKKTLLPLLIAGTVLIFCALKWSDVVEYVAGEPKLKAKYSNEKQRKLSEPDQAEQYALLAIADGWYTCLHSGLELYYLRAGEVWKYGVTAKGERGRYAIKFLRTNRVSYIIQFTGTLNECLKEEQRKLYDYPLLPENLARMENDRLLRPPFNPILR